MTRGDTGDDAAKPAPSLLGDADDALLNLNGNSSKKALVNINVDLGDTSEKNQIDPEIELEEQKVEESASPASPTMPDKGLNAAPSPSPCVTERECVTFEVGDRVKYVGNHLSLERQYAGILEVYEIHRVGVEYTYTCIKPDGGATSWIDFEDLALVLAA